MRVRKWAASALRAAWCRTAAINLIVTRRCDLRCSYCRAVRKGDGELPPQEWLHIARRLSPRFSAFTVSGGEPLLYEGLPELIGGLSQVGIAGLCTNARLIEERHLDAMPGLDYLNFSIDFADGHGDSEVSKKNAFGKLPMLAEYSRRHAFELFGTAVITGRNLDAMPGIVREMTRHGIPLNLQLVQQPGVGDAFDSAEKRARLGELQRELLAMKRSGHMIDESDEYLRGLVPFVEGSRAVDCHAGRVYLAVDTDGRLMPCQNAAAVGVPVGEIADLDAALRGLPQAVPASCRCWWNCYHRYEEWHSNPWRFMARAGMNRALGVGRLAA